MVITRRRYEAGEVIVQENDCGDTAYLIEHGQAQGHRLRPATHCEKLCEPGCAHTGPVDCLAVPWLSRRGADHPGIPPQQDRGVTGDRPQGVLGELGARPKTQGHIGRAILGQGRLAHPHGAAIVSE
jgi:hypothetical protein